MSCEQYYYCCSFSCTPPPPPPPPSVSSPCSIHHHAVAIGPSGDGSSSVSVTGRPEKNTTALPVTFALILRSAAIRLHIISLPNISVRLRSHPPQFVALHPSFWPRSREVVHTLRTDSRCPLVPRSPAPAPDPPSIPLQTERPLIYRRRPVSGGRRSRPPHGSGRSPRPAQPGRPWPAADRPRRRHRGHLLMLSSDDGPRRLSAQPLHRRTPSVRHQRRQRQQRPPASSWACTADAPTTMSAPLRPVGRLGPGRRVERWEGVHAVGRWRDCAGWGRRLGDGGGDVHHGDS